MTSMKTVNSKQKNKLNKILNKKSEKEKRYNEEDSEIFMPS